MIIARFQKNEAGQIIGFRVSNHGVSRVCAAVSALTINCVNSIDLLTNTSGQVDMDEDAGDMEFYVDKVGEKSGLLLSSLELGLLAVEREYPRQLKVYYDFIGGN